MTDPQALKPVLRVTIAPEWPGPDLLDALPLFARVLETDPAKNTWGAWLIVHRGSQTLIGDAGFHGPPDKTGTVEIGYSIVPTYRERGYATEGAQALIAWAFCQPAVRRVTAEVAADNTASLRVLNKLGMRLLQQTDALQRWELVATPQREQE